MSTFDPEALESQVYEGANATSFDPIPEGDYQAFIHEYKMREVKNRDGDTSPVVDITFELMDVDKLKEELGQETLRVRYTLWLDTVEKDGKLTIGFGRNQNVGLGRLRDALGQNDPRKPWAFSKLNGAGPVLVTIKQTPKQDDPSIIYSNVAKVAPPAGKKK